MRVARPSDSRTGFTLMELLTVMAVMGILLTAGVMSYFGARRGAEMRGAIGAVRSAIATARQNAVTHRRTTAIVFREEAGTNCFYIFEKHGEVRVVLAGGFRTDTGGAPLPAPDFWPRGAYIYDFNAGLYGRVGRTQSPYSSDSVGVNWLETGDLLQVGDSFGLQVAEKGYLPKGIQCKVKDNSSGLIKFYTTGKSSGVDPVDIEFIDRMDPAVTKKITVYPLLGLVE